MTGLSSGDDFLFVEIDGSLHIGDESLRAGLRAAVIKVTQIWNRFSRRGSISVVFEVDACLQMRDELVRAGLSPGDVMALRELYSSIRAEEEKNREKEKEQPGAGDSASSQSHHNT